MFSESEKLLHKILFFSEVCVWGGGGGSGGVMVLGKLPVPGRPPNLDYSRTKTYCACSRCKWRRGGLDILL